MPLIHIIQLEEGHIFIGNPDKIMIQFQHHPKANEWFALYKPVRLEHILEIPSWQGLYKITLEYQAIYGDDKVHTDDKVYTDDKVHTYKEYSRINESYRADWQYQLNEMKGLCASETVAAMRDMVRQMEHDVKMDVSM